MKENGHHRRTVSFPLAAFLQEALICVSIPLIVYAFAYFALQAVIRLFLG
jgi:hypothetical protein